MDADWRRMLADLLKLWTGFEGTWVAILFLAFIVGLPIAVIKGILAEVKERQERAEIEAMLERGRIERARIDADDARAREADDEARRQEREEHQRQLIEDEIQQRVEEALRQEQTPKQQEAPGSAEIPTVAELEALAAEVEALDVYLPPARNDHDENGVCRHCQVPPDHPIFEGWKTTHSPGEVEQLQAKRLEPHRIEDGRCRDCSHPAGEQGGRLQQWLQEQKEKDDPERLSGEHRSGQHEALRDKCPECEAQRPAIEAKREAAQAVWNALHGPKDHSCPECAETKSYRLDMKYEREHFLGSHKVRVLECYLCLVAEQGDRTAEAHARGEHEDFDYQDKNAVTDCVACRERQWEWYERAAESVGDPVAEQAI
jgi:hypothetical protein